MERSVPVMRTIGKAVTLRGVGLFTAQACEVRLCPADLTRQAAGIAFVVRGDDGQESIPADVRRVVKSGRNTVLAGGDGRPAVMTTEHLLSAAAGLGITHLRVELSGPEVPILDGSARAFAEALREAGIVEAAGRVGAVVIDTPHRLEFSANQWIEFAPPAAGAECACVYQYALGYELADDAGEVEVLEQAARFALDYQRPDAAGYLQRVAPARTFCTLREARQWKQAGMFAHVKPGDVLVLATAGQMAADAAVAQMCERRMEDEPARHKLLDLIGDLMLASLPVIGQITAHRTGHEHNHAAARYLQQIAG